jgi:hypothetical protein
LWNRPWLSLFQEMGLLRDRIVAVQLKAHIDECGQRYEASREAIRDAKSDLTTDICELRKEQARMDERNRKAISGVQQLLWAIAGGTVLVLLAAIELLSKAQLHIPG